MSTTTAINGLVQVPGFLTSEEQRDLLNTIDGQPWQTDLRRRVQHYGYRYDYTRRTVGPDLYLGPLPDWSATLADTLHRQGYAPCPLDQLIVNEYQPGQGIAPHVDCVPCFADTVLSISLGSAVVLTMSRPAASDRVDILLESGSLLVISGPARYEWRHGIAARKTDRWQGRTLTRGRRVSLTYRTVLT